MASKVTGNDAYSTSVPLEVVVPVGASLAVLLGLVTFLVHRVYRKKLLRNRALQQSDTLRELSNHQNNLRWLDDLTNWKELGLHPLRPKKDKRSSELEVKCRGMVEEDDGDPLLRLPKPPPASFPWDPRTIGRKSWARLRCSFWSRKGESLQIPEIRITVPNDGEMKTLENMSMNTLDGHRRWTETFERDMNLAVMGVLEARRQRMAAMEATADPCSRKSSSQMKILTGSFKRNKPTQSNSKPKLGEYEEPCFSAGSQSFTSLTSGLLDRTSVSEKSSVRRDCQFQCLSSISTTLLSTGNSNAGIQEIPHQPSTVSNLSAMAYLGIEPSITFAPEITRVASILDACLTPDLTSSPTLSIVESSPVTPSVTFSVSMHNCMSDNLKSSLSYEVSPQPTLQATLPSVSSIPFSSAPVSSTSLAYRNSTATSVASDGRPQSIVSLSGLKGVRLWTNETADLFYYSEPIEA